MDVEITEEFIKSVATNANLLLSEDEIKTFEQDFQDVLGNFEKLAKADLDDVNPSFHPVEIKDKIREDEVKPCITNEEALSNVEHKQDNYIRGPKIV